MMRLGVRLMTSTIITLVVLAAGVASLAQKPDGERSFDGDLVLGQKVPDKSEDATVKKAMTKIARGSDAFKALNKNTNPDIVFKDEEPNEPDHYMTDRLKEKVDSLATKVKSEWPGKKLRITEAWDEQDEHGANSTHYEARAVDITVSDQDGAKLGRLGRLAVEAGFDWVFYENSLHVHASVKKDDAFATSSGRQGETGEQKSFKGRVDDLDYIANNLNLCQAILRNGDDQLIVTTQEHRLQTLLELAFATGKSAEVSYTEKGNGRYLTRVKVNRESGGPTPR